MKFSIEAHDAITNILAGKLRSALAVLGILVGTASVVAMVSGGKLATRQALLQFKELGTNLIAVSVTNQDEGRDLTTQPKTKIPLSAFTEIKQHQHEFVALAPYTTSFKTITYQGHSINGMVLGTTESLMDVIKIKIQQGRFISVLDKKEPFCVLGQNLYQKIRKYKRNPMGTQIWLGNQIFTIIGITKPWKENSFVYADINDAVIIPIESAMAIDPYTDINNFIVKFKQGSNIDEVQHSLAHCFQKHLPDRRLFQRSAKEVIDSMVKQKEILTVFLAFIGGISLIVGGIGVMNIMLVSVVERRREIGIRLAIGAKRREIQELFLIESVMLSLFGGICGVILGILISWIIALSKHWDFTLFLVPPVIGFGVSVLVGIFFGYYPARKAAKLNPIDTLHAE